jgi:transcriptional regulator with XRE-family HTH domain
MREDMADPATLRRHLRTELRRARTQAGLTQREVADALDWSPSKVLRIEGGQVAVSTTDLKALLQLYKIEDDDLVQRLASMARQSKQQPWSHYRDVISAEVAAYFGYEASAAIIRQFEPLIVPGLLQAEGYTKALLRLAYHLNESTAERHIEVRQERQELLDREAPPEVFGILGEPVIQQMVGGPEVMRQQLRRLLELGTGPVTSIQIIPFAWDAHVGLRGPFTLLEFPEEGPPDLLYMESQSSAAVFLDADRETNRYLNYFWELEAAALDRDESRDLIAATLGGLDA